MFINNHAAGACLSWWKAGLVIERLWNVASMLDAVPRRCVLG